ncbi:YCF48-related protein [Aureivirga sp. CE67]|uniref:T9SS type A sorting domain-containing protein n=1 Tax=Aureivirga sp. CE67 TaxID=1788983 RepID=UPI0018CB448A|nr:YCF48-related protein [Aureivirga sp. CE67]
MRKITTLLIFTPLLAFSQWSLYQPKENLKKIGINDSNTIFAIDNFNNPIIYSHTESNFVFEELQTDQQSSSFIEDIEFVNGNVAYTAGGTYFGTTKNIIYKTIDGGANWEIIFSEPLNGEAEGITFGSYNFVEIDFLNENVGIFRGDYDNFIVKTTDGGQTLEEIPIDFAGNLNNIKAIKIIGENTFLVSRAEVIQESYIYQEIRKTTDNGETWSIVYNRNNFFPTEPIELNATINQFQFIDENIGFAVGQNGLFLKTTDGGTTWEENDLPPETNITSVYFVDENVGFINNNEGIYKTTDGGETWEEETLSHPSKVKQIIVTENNEAFALAENGIHKTSNVVLSVEENELASKITVFPNPSSDFINISTNQNISNIQVFTNDGRLVKEISKNENNIDIKNLETGIYFIKLNINQKTIFKKFTKQ